MNSRSFRVTVALAVVMIASSASAMDWKGQLQMVESDLRTQNYRHARKWSIKLINSMSDHLGTGQSASYTFALTVAYRAMAEAGLRKYDEADWYWHVATSLHPKIAQTDWKHLGDVGQWAASYDGHLEASDSDRPALIPVRKSEPKCPLGAINGAYYQPVRVGAVITVDGTARCPSLVEPTEAPTLAYAAFEALKRWQFQTTEPTKYEVTVNFQPPRR